jgi:hypothetical protein
MVEGPLGLTETIGSGYTVMSFVAVPMQPLAAVPITVYVLVLVGAARMDAPLVALRPVAGVQLYDTAPLAVRLADPPLQNAVAVAGLILTVGDRFTLTVLVSVLVQPPASVAVTV